MTLPSLSRCLASFALLAAFPATLFAKTFTIGGASVPDSSAYPDLAAFTSAVKCLRPGDRVLLEEGREFHGTLHLSLCSDADKSSGVIEVRSFHPGSPADPSAVQTPAVLNAAFTAARLNLRWERVPVGQYPAGTPSPKPGSAIYRLGPLDRQVGEVFVGEKRLLLARTPNDPGDGPGRFASTTRIVPHAGGCPVAACVQSAEGAPVQQLQKTPAGLLNQAYVAFRNSPWSIARSGISAIDAAHAELKLLDPLFGPQMPVNVAPAAGYGFVLLNSPAFLDTLGEWFFEPAGRNLYIVWNADSPPAESETQLAFVEPGSGEKYKHEDAAMSFWGGRAAAGDGYQLDISRLVIRRSAGPGIQVLQVPHVRITQVRISQPGESGISVYKAGMAEIASSFVADSPGNGVNVSATPSVKVLSNTITRVGTLSNQNRFEMNFNGVRAGDFDSAQIAQNRISFTGYAGIMLSESPTTGDSPKFSVQVVDNVITDFCRLLNDCGAIYINGNKPGASSATLADGTSKRVSGNQIMTPRGNMDGSPGARSAKPAGPPWDGTTVRMVGAVYLDHGASNYDIRGNQVSGFYEPYGWRVFNKGVFNACSRADASACNRTDSAYRCYTQALDQCNSVHGSQ